MAVKNQYRFWKDEELAAKVKAIQTSRFNGSRQVTFQGQTVIYKNDATMERTEKQLLEELDRRDNPSGIPKKTKRVVITTRSKGF